MQSFLLSRIPTFLAAARNGTFSSAATKLRVNQPAVTKSIRQLEESLGTELFIRQKGRLELTAAGKILFDRAIEIEFSAEAVTAQIDELNSDFRGYFRIAAGPVFASIDLPKIIPIFAQEFPKIKLELISGNSTEMFSFLQKGEINCYLGASPRKEHDKLGPQFQTIDLGIQKYGLFTRRLHPLAGQSCASEIDLHAFPLATLWSSKHTLQTLRSIYASYGCGAPKININASSINIIEELLENHNYVCFLPERVASKMDVTSIKNIISPQDYGGIKVGCTFRNSLSEVGYFKRFLQLVRSQN